MDDDTTELSTEAPTTAAGDTEYTLTLANTDGERGEGSLIGDIVDEADRFITEGYDEGEYIPSEYGFKQRMELWVDGDIEEEYSEDEKTVAATTTSTEKEVEEEQLVEEPPPDPAAPFNFSDSKERLREPFQLRPEQVMEVEMLWALFQDYTPAYTNLDNFITEKELIYMLKALLLMTYTPEQLQELIEFCVRPPHPEGHITYDQFLKMVTLRQRDFLIEDELRASLHVYDPDKTGLVDREHLRDMLEKTGNKLPLKMLDSLIKEIDITNDGTIGIEDMISCLCIDLNKEDIQMMQDTLKSGPGSGLPPNEVDEHI